MIECINVWIIVIFGFLCFLMGYETNRAIKKIDDFAKHMEGDTEND